MDMRLLLALFTCCALLTDSILAARGQDPASFVARTDLVVLHVTVQDTRGRWVPDLPESAFQVIEDRAVQQISHFGAHDAPVTVGLLIDNSISMRESRDLVIAAATEFAAAGHPDDELFALAFNERVVPVFPEQAPFAESPAALAQALTTAISARGLTAFFDAVHAGFAYAGRGRHARKALVVIADGGDNASARTFDEVLGMARASNAVIYGVALVDPIDPSAEPGRLEELARATGGASFRPQTARDVAEVLREVAADIRHTYTVGYTPSRPPDGAYRAVRVVVEAPDSRRLTVRTRSGYTAAPAPAPKGSGGGEDR
jgi:Ca-activated chloride channel family protein